MEIAKDEDRIEEERGRAEERDWRLVIDIISTLSTNQSESYVMTHHLKERVKNRKLKGLSTQRPETEIGFLDIVGTCNTLVNSNGVGREVRGKELVVAIDKPVPSQIITRSEAVYNS